MKKIQQEFCLLYLLLDLLAPGIAPGNSRRLGNVSLLGKPKGVIPSVSITTWRLASARF